MTTWLDFLREEPEDIRQALNVILAHSGIDPDTTVSAEDAEKVRQDTVFMANSKSIFAPDYKKVAERLEELTSDQE